MLPRKCHSIIPWSGIVLGRFQCSCFSDPCIIGGLFPILWNHLFSEFLVRVFIYTQNVYWLCCQVLVMSHEKADAGQMDSYFGNKFYPARPVYVIGRSYKAEPVCKPRETLWDNWMDRSHAQAMSPQSQLCIMASCVPHSIEHHVCRFELGKSCQSLPPDRAHACSYGITFRMTHIVDCFTLDVL